MDLVDRVGGGGHRGIEPERGDSPADIVVDRLGYADDGNAFGHQLEGDAEGAVAADRDERVEAQCMKCGDKLIGPVAFVPGTVGTLTPPLEGIAAISGAENGAAEVGDASHLGRAEWHDFIVAEQAVEPAPDADALPAAV